jgi:D-3-phosphoglycerate dehydrogenase
VRVRLALTDGTSLRIGGTLSGPRNVAKLVEIDDFDLEVPLSEHLVVMRYADRPGVVGAVGGALGHAGVNIGGMQVSRDAVGGQAVMVLTVDASPGAEVLAGVAREVEADLVESVDLV